VRWALAAVTAVLVGCAGQPVQPRIETVEVKVPVTVPCLPAELPKRPAIADKAALLAMGDYDLVLELAAERDELLAYSGQLEAVVKACR